MPKQPYLECGKILTTHGVDGCVRAESWCDTCEVLAALPRVFFREKDGAYTERRVTRAFLHKGGVVLGLEGISDMNAAIPLRETILYAARQDLPIADGAMFLSDMIGLPVRDACDPAHVYGTLADVGDSPAAPLYDILTPAGQHVLLPAVPAFVDRVCDEGIYIRPIPGFFDEEG